MRKLLIGVGAIAVATLSSIYLAVPVLGPVLGITPWPVERAPNVAGSSAGATPNVPENASKPRFARINPSLTGNANEDVEYFRVDLRKRARAAAFDAFALP